MELKDFISGTLVEIIEGVKEAQDKVKLLGAHVNPTGLTIANSGTTNPHGPNINLSQIVEFKVAITVQEGTSTKAGIGVVSGILGLGAQGQSDNNSSSISKIKFSIPTLFPGSSVNK